MVVMLVLRIVVAVIGMRIKCGSDDSRRKEGKNGEL